MARGWFGGTSNDYLFEVVTGFGASLIALNAGSLVGTCWSAQTGGTQYTDLLDANGVAIGSVIVTGSQLPRFQGPDGIMEMWLDFGAGRVLIAASDQATVAAASATEAATSATAAQEAAAAATEGRVLPDVGTYAYNSDGTVSTGPLGETYTYNVDQTVHTITYQSVTRTLTYGPYGIASVA